MWLYLFGPKIVASTFRRFVFKFNDLMLVCPGFLLMEFFEDV